MMLNKLLDSIVYANLHFSLMKMIVGFARTTGRLTRNQLEHSIKRNFGGFDPDDQRFKPMKVFQDHCPVFEILEEGEDGEPATDSIGLIQASLFGASNRLVVVIARVVYNKVTPS